MDVQATLKSPRAKWVASFAVVLAAVLVAGVRYCQFKTNGGRDSASEQQAATQEEDSDAALKRIRSRYTRQQMVAILDEWNDAASRAEDEANHRYLFADDYEENRERYDKSRPEERRRLSREYRAEVRRSHDLTELELSVLVLYLALTETPVADVKERFTESHRRRIFREWDSITDEIHAEVDRKFPTTDDRRTWQRNVREASREIVRRRKGFLAKHGLDVGELGEIEVEGIMSHWADE